MTDPRFQGGWPDAYIGGYRQTRTLLRTDLEMDEPGITFKIYPAIFEFEDEDVRMAPTLAIVGDLTIWAAQEWAGVRAHTNLFIRDIPALTDEEWETANELTARHALWLQHGLYDYVAQTMRVMLAGGASLTVPVTTPEPQLLFVDVDEVLNEDDPAETT